MAAPFSNAAGGPPLPGDVVLDPPFQISLNSTDAISKNASYENECVFQVPAIFLKEYQAFRLRLKGFTIPVSWYQIDSTTNTLSLNYNLTNYTITITPGNYSTSTFPAVFTAAVLAATGLTITPSLNSFTNKWTFTASAAFTFRSIRVGTSMYAVLGFPVYPKDSTASYTATLSGSYTLESTVPVDFSGNNSIFVTTSLSNNNVQSYNKGGGSSQYIGRVPVPTQFTGILSADPIAFQECELSDKVINNFTVTLLDENLNVLQATLPWTMNIDISYAFNPANNTRALYPRAEAAAGTNKRRYAEVAGTPVDGAADTKEDDAEPTEDEQAQANLDMPFEEAAEEALVDEGDDEEDVEMGMFDETADEQAEAQAAKIHEDTFQRIAAADDVQNTLRQQAYAQYEKNMLAETRTRMPGDGGLVVRDQQPIFSLDKVDPFRSNSGLAQALGAAPLANVQFGTNSASVGPANQG